MSDGYSQAIDADLAPEAPAETSQAPEQPAEQPERRYFDLDDDVAQRYVRVKVDGEDVEVPLGEALRGYSREADYTRKTQALAQQRAEAEYALTLQRALQAQPEETIRLLARQAGLTLAEEQQLRQQVQQQPQREPWEDEDRFSDPMETRLERLERELQERDARDQRAAADQHLRQAIGGLQSRYQATDEQVREVVSQALQMGAGPDAFDMIFRSIEFDRMQQARQQYQQNRTAEDQQRQAAAQRAGEVVSTGGSAAQAGGPPPRKTEFSSYREGIEAALEQYDVR